MIKIDYANGTGDGHVIWTLGQGGNFTLIAPPSVQSPWFSHQHDVTYVDDSTILVFDDGNTRRLTDPTADSRGQEYVLNEQTMTATLVVNADLGNYSPALGAAQLLPNGNLQFTSGLQGNVADYPTVFGQTIEVQPNGTMTFEQRITGYEYRSYLVNNLYGSTCTSQAPPPISSTPDLKTRSWERVRPSLIRRARRGASAAQPAWRATAAASPAATPSPPRRARSVSSRRPAR